MGRKHKTHIVYYVPVVKNSKTIILPRKNQIREVLLIISIKLTAASHLTHTSGHVKSTSVPEDSETDETSLHRRHGAAAAFQPQHPVLDYMLLSDTREGVVVPRSTAEKEADVI